MKNSRVKSKWIIGLSGSMLSGKSTALKYFAACGADTISCDEIDQKLRTCPAVRKKIYAAVGTAQTYQLAALVFNNRPKHKKIEQILHPLILKEVRAQIKKSKARLVVVEAPLLFEAGWDQWTDLNIVVLADPKTLPARLKARKFTQAEYDRRMKFQLPEAQKVKRADVVFFHATKAQLKKSVERFCKVLEVLPHQ